MSAKVPVRKESGPRGAGLIPWDDFDRWFEDRFPSRLFGRWPAWPSAPSALTADLPRMDVLDKDKEVVLRAELPGIDKKDLDISITDHSVTVRATHKEESEKEDEQYVMRELHRGEFQRTCPLPDYVDTDKAKATFRDGVLELVLPKSEPAKRRTIKVD